MNWDNDTILSFLELYKSNPCIWDPEHKFHKNKVRVNDAWINIQENLGADCTVKDLKKKKESLMSAYRHYKTRIEKSKRSEYSNDIYKPSWFAFPLMDSFLDSVYKCTASRSTECDDQISTEPTESDELDESNKIWFISTEDSPSSPQILPDRRKTKNSPELVEAKQQMEQAINFIKQFAQEHHPANVDDECTIFGQLIAKKMRKLSEERRDVMMVKINQLFVDEHMKKSS